MGKLSEAWVNAAFQEADLSNSKLDRCKLVGIVVRF